MTDHSTHDVPLVPDNLDPNEKINKWINDMNPVDKTAAMEVGDASTSQRHSKPKKT